MENKSKNYKVLQTIVKIGKVESEFVHGGRK